ncbi:MAG TPA: hypothetical protein PLP33_27885 [Leptospiraceae bacterium]|nr:hypothetical protein [Leptospiraceae bacterium]
MAEVKNNDLKPAEPRVFENSPQPGWIPVKTILRVEHGNEGWEAGKYIYLPSDAVNYHLQQGSVEKV